MCVYCKAFDNGTDQTHEDTFHFHGFFFWCLLHDWLVKSCINCFQCVHVQALTGRTTHQQALEHMWWTHTHTETHLSHTWLGGWCRTHRIPQSWTEQQCSASCRWAYAYARVLGYKEFMSYDKYCSIVF